MALIHLGKPGTGRRQANQQERDAAEIQRLRDQVAAAEIERDNALVDARESQLQAEEANERAADRERIAELLEKRNRQVIRQAADIARLRQAVREARPRITFATPPRVPPFAPLETIPDPAPEPLPVGRWLPFPPDDEATQEIALGDVLTGRT